MISEKKLPLLIFILPIIALLLTVILFLFIYAVQQNKIMNNNLNYIENSYIKNAIDIEKKKVDSEFSILINNCLHVEDILKPKLKERVGQAYGIMMNLYKRNKNMPDEKIKKIIKDAIDPIRFEGDKDYFFIFDLDGVNILFPPNKSMEGKNFLNFRDAEGKYPVQKIIEIAKTKHEGFEEWHWYKPSNYSYKVGKSKMYKKLGYIKYFKPFNWIIGTGLYVNDEIKKIQKGFIDIYLKEKINNKEYFILLEPTWNGNARILANSNRPYTKGEYISVDFKDVNYVSYMKKIFRAVYSGKRDGIIRYSYKKNNQKHDEIIYFNFYKTFTLLTISGFNLDSVEDVILKAKEQSKKNFKKYAEETIVVSAFVILFIGSIFVVISKGVNNMLFQYQNEVKKREEKLREFASYDELTKIYNRRRFNTILEYEISMSKRYRLPMSLVMFDLDHFKRVNDKYGHPAGDKVLRIIVRKVRMNIRATDTFARWGGEEFFIILPKTNISETLKMAEHLRAGIEGINFGAIKKVTCSFGVTEFRVYDNKDQLTSRADKALYLAKSKGRNRVEYL